MSLGDLGTRVGGAQIVSMTHVTHANVYILNTHASYTIFTHLGCPKDALARSKASREMRDVGPGPGAVSARRSDFYTRTTDHML